MNRVDLRSPGGYNWIMAGWKGLSHVTMAILLAAGAALSGVPDCAAAGPAADIIKKVQAETRTSSDAAAGLLKAAAKIKDLSVRAALCEKAFEYGMAGPRGYGSAIGALNMLDAAAPTRAETWRTKRIEVYRQIYSRGPRKDRLKNARVLVAAEVAEAKRLVKAQQWLRALVLYRQAHGTARAMKLADEKHIHAQIRRTQDLQKFHARLDALKEAVAKDPSNTREREELVMLYLVGLDSPDEAARHLNATCAELLRTNVAMAAKPAAELADRDFFTLGKWYFSLAQGSPIAEHAVLMLVRAKENLERYLEVQTKMDATRLRAVIALADVRKALGGHGVYERPPGAVVFLTFENKALFTRDGRTYVRDESEAKHNGLVVGPALAARAGGAAMVFNGTSHIDMGNPPGLQITGDMTVCMWINPATLSVRQNPMNKSYGGEGTWTLEIDGSINYFYGSSGGDVKPYSSYKLPGPLKPGRWTHVAAVRDMKGKTVTWYADGQAVFSGPTQNACKASKANLLFGKGYIGNFRGMMDDICVFKRALPAREIRMLLGAK